MRDTTFAIADNSGALTVRCIGSKYRKDRAATVGDRVVVALRTFQPGKKVNPKTNRYVALMVTASRPFYRPDGSTVKFDAPVGVLVNAQNDPLGTTVRTPLARELKRKVKSMKLVSLSRGSC